MSDGPHTAFQMEAGCRMIIEAMLFYVALNLESTGKGVAIVTDFYRDDTGLESDGKVVNYTIVYTDQSTRGVSHTATSAFQSHTLSRLHCTVTEVCLYI